MSNLRHYYDRAKSGLGGVSKHETARLGADYLIAGAVGAGIGLVAAGKGDLDLKIGGMPVPIDGLIAVGLGAAGLSMHSPELKSAGIAAAGAASARVFGKFFSKGVAAHGDIEDGTYSMGAGPSYDYGMGWGADSTHDALVEAAKHL